MQTTRGVAAFDPDGEPIFAVRLRGKTRALAPAPGGRLALVNGNELVLVG